MATRTVIVLMVTALLLPAALGVLISLNLINTAALAALNVTVVFLLVLVTMIYTNRTAEIAGATRYQAEATRQQANASVEMAKEMREQRVMASRPVIIQKAIHKKVVRTSGSWDRLSHFEVYNAGNGPAIGLEILLLDKEKRLLEKQTEPLFLRAAESITFSPSGLVNHVGSICYLLCRYQSVFSHGKGQIWYQTWLPFEPIKPQRGDIIVKHGELKFCEVFEKEDY